MMTMHCKSATLLLAMLTATAGATAAFVTAPRRCHPALLVRQQQQQQRELAQAGLFVAADTTTANNNADSNAWGEEHLIHGAQEIHEYSDQELLQAEQDAALDAYDLSDAGMEAVMEERAVILANEMAHKLKMLANKVAHKIKEEAQDNNEWREKHLIHGVQEIHEDSDQEFLQAEQDGVLDAYDLSDLGMEAAMEERAVMLANEMAHKLKEKAQEAALLKEDKVEGS
jgi:hypothetical protein